MPRLTTEQIQPFLSPYLMGGWRKDQLVLDTVDVELGCIRGVVHATEYFLPNDGLFHLTVPSAFIWVAQLAIIYACWDEKLAEKPGEIFIRDIHLKCKSPVSAASGIEFVLRLASKRPVSDGVFYSGRISIDRDAFVGDATFVLPLRTLSPSRKSIEGVT